MSGHLPERRARLQMGGVTSNCHEAGEQEAIHVFFNKLSTLCNTFPATIKLTK